MAFTCLDLALQGERLCNVGDCGSGVQFFEAAMQVGTDDLNTLSAIYSQLGNAYFYLNDYVKALEYHKHDLNLARTRCDRIGEAKASGNLGNTLKMFGKFDEAIVCCRRHLELSREFRDKVGEARALYNLGNMWHAKAKKMGCAGSQDPGELPQQVRQCLTNAASLYQENLTLVRVLADRPAQGRACGNLGNAHYLLGNFSTAIEFHEERLSVAREFGDKAAERRAHTNLGNAHIFIGEFEIAADQYRRSLEIAIFLQDLALEAQVCYSLGNVYTLLRDFSLAVHFHKRHLTIAEQLSDSVGEGRAYWSLGNAYRALGNRHMALDCASRHLLISKQIGDEIGKVTAQMNLDDFSALSEMMPTSANNGNSSADATDAALRRSDRARRFSMENMELMKLTPDKQGAMAQTETAAGGRHMNKRFPKSASIHTDAAASSQPETGSKFKRASNGGRVADFDDDNNGFFDLLSRTQSRRINDQRCSVRLLERESVSSKSKLDDSDDDDGINDPLTASGAPVTSPGREELMDMVAGFQCSRLNNQRTSMPAFPGLTDGDIVKQLMSTTTTTAPTSLPDNAFFEMLLRSQDSRIEDQRSKLPEELPHPTIPDEDFFSMILKIQSCRLDEQRSNLLPNTGSCPATPRLTSKRSK